MPSSTVRYKALFVGKNTSWWSGDKLTTSINGHELKCLADDFNLAQLCELPTYVGHSGKPDSLLDLAFSSDSSMVASVDTLQPVSDHCPFCLRPMRLEDQELIISMLSRMKNDGTFVMPSWRLCIALFYP